MTLQLLAANAGAMINDCRIEEIDRLIAEPGNLVWLDIGGETTPPSELLEREFGFHPLSIEDVQHRHQRPKLDPYDTYAFVVLYAIPAQSDGEGAPAEFPPDVARLEDWLDEIDIFLGRNYLVTVHTRASPAIESTRRRWQQDPADFNGAALLFHALLDTVIDQYFPVADGFADRVDRLEDAIFDERERQPPRSIALLRKQLIQLRRVLGPTREVANALARQDLPFTTGETVPYFEDVYDHVIRLTDSIDISRDLLAGALDLYLSMTSNRLNKVMKTLTGASIILMSMALLAGIWGMNFENMPELDWRFGYAFALSVMAVIGGALYFFFRRHDYL